jgi:hypothetical protein
MSAITESIPLPPLFYHGTEASYWRQDECGGWIKVNETSAKHFIADHGYSKTPSEAGKNSEVDRCIMRIQSRQNVAYVGPLAGCHSGIHAMGTNRVLVTESPRFITPREGDWPTLALLWERMLVDGDNDQRPFLYGWLKSALETFQNRRWKASQLLAFAGPVGTGKSLTQNLMTEILGGRCAKPYQFMMGHTNFNAHLFKGEHLMLEDEAESVDIRSRRHFAATIKTLLTARDQNCHGKNKDALILTPLWRMTLSLNDDPERLQVLPPLDSDVRDKIIILKVNECEMPMPTDTEEMEAAFWRQLVRELPAFLHYIQSYVIPEELAHPRYGIAAYQHPDIVEKLQHTNPELQLMELIDRTVFGNRYHREAWEGSAAELETAMRDGDFAPHVQRLLRHQNTCGTYLGRLKDYDEAGIRGRITSRLVNGYTVWMIQPPNHEPEEQPWRPGPDDHAPPPAPPVFAEAA